MAGNVTPSFVFENKLEDYVAFSFNPCPPLSTVGSCK